MCRTDLNHAGISADAVKWLLLRALPDRRIPRLELWNACVGGVLGPSRVEMKTMPCFVGCDLEGIDVTDSGTLGLEVIGGRLGFLRADRLRTSGTVLLREHRRDAGDGAEAAGGLSRSVRIPGGVLLSGAKIHGNLDVRGGIVGPIAGMGTNETVALLADGMVRLDGAVIEGDLKLDGGRFIAKGFHVPGWKRREEPTDNIDDLYAIKATGIKVSASVDMTDRFHASGSVRFVLAQIGGDLDCSGAAGAHLLLPNERLRPRQIAGLLFAFAGVGCAVADGLTGGGGRPLGDAMVAAAAAFWGLTTVMVKANRVLRTLSPAKLLIYQLGGSAPILFAFAWFSGELAVPAATAAGWWWLAYQTVIVAFVSYLV